MYHSAADWLDILTSYGLAMGLFLLGAGVACTLIGWRLSRWVVAADFALLGIGVSVYSIGHTWLGWLFALVFGLGAALGAWRFPKHGAILLAALVGGYCTGACVLHLEGSPPPTVIATILGFLVVGALGVVLYDQVVVAIASVQGAALFVAGLAIILYMSPVWYGGFHDLAVRYRFFMPTLIMGIGVVGFFFQLSEIQGERSSQVNV